MRFNNILLAFALLFVTSNLYAGNPPLRIEDLKKLEELPVVNPSSVRLSEDGRYVFYQLTDSRYRNLGLVIRATDEPSERRLAGYRSSECETLNDGSLVVFPGDQNRLAI